jgi:hypothetical protein
VQRPRFSQPFAPCFASAGDGQPVYLVDQCSCTTILGSSYADSRRKHTTSNYPNRDLSLYRNLQLFACTPGSFPLTLNLQRADLSWSSRFFTGDCILSPFWEAARSAGAGRAAKLSSLPAPKAQGGQRFGDCRGRIIPVRFGLHLESERMTGPKFSHTIRNALRFFGVNTGICG